jgi:hypothetical protein
MNTRPPLPASAGPPLIGASRQSAPRVFAAAATSRHVSGSIVLRSMSVAPVRTVDSAPSAPR